MFETFRIILWADGHVGVEYKFPEDDEPLVLHTAREVDLSDKSDAEIIEICRALHQRFAGLDLSGVRVEREWRQATRG